MPFVVTAKQQPCCLDLVLYATEYEYHVHPYTLSYSLVMFVPRERTKIVQPFPQLYADEDDGTEASLGRSSCRSALQPSFALPLHVIDGRRTSFHSLNLGWSDEPSTNTITAPNPTHSFQHVLSCSLSTKFCSVATES